MKKKLLSLVLATVMVTGTGATVWASGDGEVIEKYGTELTNLDLDGTLHGQYEGQSIVIPVMSGDFEKAINDVVPIFEELSGAEVTVESVPGEQFTDKLQLDLNNTKRCCSCTNCVPSQLCSV